jgi:hypothetical protein
VSVSAGTFAVKGCAATLVLLGAALVAGVARGGHEFPVYPSYYPHLITLETMTPEVAAESLRANRIQAYIGPTPELGPKLPESIAAVESLGSFVVVRVNPASPLARDAASSCTLAGTVIREIAAHGGSVTIHPYPVTPLHGDYLDYADLADTARARLLAASDPPSPRIKVRAAGAAQALVPRSWLAHAEAWDATIETVGAADLVEAAATWTNGWMGPPWLRKGWFQALQLLETALPQGPARARAEADRVRLEALNYASSVERINLERDLVSALTTGCRALVAGYTVKRQYVDTDYYAGIENLDYDFITGLASPMFIRTVKLKDFPWNGILTLGIDARPAAAWNPVAGFDDRFGRLLWSALGDPALMPAPGDTGWMLNRISDVRPTTSAR